MEMQHVLMPWWFQIAQHFICFFILHSLAKPTFLSNLNSIHRFLMLLQCDSLSCISEETIWHNLKEPFLLNSAAIGHQFTLLAYTVVIDCDQRAKGLDTAKKMNRFAVAIGEIKCWVCCCLCCHGCLLGNGAVFSGVVLIEPSDHGFKDRWGASNSLFDLIFSHQGLVEMLSKVCPALV